MRLFLGRIVCRLIGHRMVTRHSFDIEWDFCTRGRDYITTFRVRAP